MTAEQRAELLDGLAADIIRLRQAHACAVECGFADLLAEIDHVLAEVQLLRLWLLQSPARRRISGRLTAQC
jgi:hypothetical protein